MTAAARVVYFLVLPVLVSLFCCRCCRVKFSPAFALVYTAGFCGISCLETHFSLPGLIPLLLCIFLLSACGMIFCRQPPALSVSASSLAFSVFYLTSSLVQSFGFWLASGFLPCAALEYWDLLLALAELFLLAGTLAFFLRLYPHLFEEIFSGLGSPMLLLLAVPLVFTACAEGVVFSYVYGNTIIWDKTEGIIYPVVDSMEIVFLHLLGYGGMFAILAAFRSLSRAVRKNQDAEQLKFQMEQQQTYLLEAQARYGKTRAFRHDIKNHLTLLQELLSRGETERAGEYLSSLGAAADSLSFPVHSGNPAADVILENKLLAAQQSGIPVECELEIPSGCAVADMDWCVILANGLDNAIAACRRLPQKDRYIRAASRKRSGFFLLHIENSCGADAMSEYGVGLSNIRAAAEKYGGMMETSLDGNRYSLDVLLPVSQHESTPFTSNPLVPPAENL